MINLRLVCRTLAAALWECHEDRVYVNALRLRRDYRKSEPWRASVTFFGPISGVDGDRHYEASGASDAAALAALREALLRALSNAAGQCVHAAARHERLARDESARGDRLAALVALHRQGAPS